MREVAHGDSSFHLPVGEMTITLDDVYNLLHLPIQGSMLDHDAVVDRAHEITQMTRLLGMSDVAARAEAKTSMVLILVISY